MASERFAVGHAESLRDAMNRWAEVSLVRPHRLLHGAETIDVPIDLYETAEDFVLRALLPGAQPDEVEITLLGDQLRISGAIQMHQADPQQDVSWLVHEVPHGSFLRAIMLPSQVDADKAEATFDAGVLTLRLPKAKADRPRQIKITF